MEIDREWHLQSFAAGQTSRCNDLPLSACPPASEVGVWQAQSWCAGWVDADMETAIEETDPDTGERD